VRAPALILSVVIACSSLPARVGPATPQARPGRQIADSGDLPLAFLENLHRLLPSSGQVFSGTVIGVKHQNINSATALPTTAIRFRVDNGIRGARAGQTIEIKEWGGLWNSGEQYHAGERVLLFLYLPSKLGLTSPVGRQSGRFSVNKSGGVLLKGEGGPAKPFAIQKVVSAIGREQNE
jgi:hypothetical protein